MPSSSNQQAQVTGTPVDAAVAAASRITSNILTRDAKVHAIIGGQALKLLGNDRRTSVGMKARQIMFFETNCYRTWTSWWIDQRLKLEQDCFNWIADTPSIQLINWFSKRSVNELSHQGFINSLSRPCTDIINVGMFRLRQLTKEQEGGWGMPISIYMIRMQCSIPCISPCSVLSPAYNHTSNVATG